MLRQQGRVLIVIDDVAGLPWVIGAAETSTSPAAGVRIGVRSVPEPFRPKVVAIPVVAAVMGRHLNPSGGKT
jgi:uncharacterized protein YraI